MGDAFQKRNALRYARPRLHQLSTKVGAISLVAGTVLALFGIDPSIADALGGTAGQIAIGAVGTAAGLHAVFRDDGSA